MNAAGLAQGGNLEKHFKWLETERAGGANPALDRASSTRLREQLIAEIQQLEAELASLQADAERVDFSMQQTCREMIHSRHRLFMKLCR